MSPHRAANDSCRISWGRRKAERHMTGRRQGAFVAIVIAGQLVAASIAAAQSPQPPGSIPNAANRPSAPAQSGQQAVPLPPPAPLPKTGAPGAAQGGQQAQSNSPLQQLKEWLPPDRKSVV